MESFKNYLLKSIEVKKKILEDENLLFLINKAADTILNAFKKGKTLFLCGNGGSFSDACHLAAEFTGKFFFDRKPLKAIVLGANPSHTTAVGNDYGFDQIFSRELEALGEEGDVLIGISTSGNSLNVINAIKVAKRKNIKTIAFLGKGGGKLKDLVDIPIIVPSNLTPHIQEAHITLGHFICYYIEKKLFGAEK